MILSLIKVIQMVCPVWLAIGMLPNLGFVSGVPSVFIRAPLLIPISGVMAPNGILPFTSFAAP